jgi:hypothetical protein
MIIHVLLCITFWHCEAIAANTKTGEAALPGAAFCKVGFRQSWPGESSSNSIKNIDTTHFWQQVPVINNYCASVRLGSACPQPHSPNVPRAAQ